MNRIIIIIAAIFFSWNISHAQDTEKFEVKIGNFTELNVTDNINVIYSTNPDSIGYVQFRCVPSMANSIMLTNNKKGKLTIQVATESVDSPKLPTVFVYSKFLQSVDNAADSVVRITEITEAPSIKLKTTGNGKIIANKVDCTTLEASVATGKGTIIVGGQCAEGMLTNMGTGEILADKLKCNNALCKVIGTGSIGCNVTGKLTIRGTGTGKVYYVGKPAEIKIYQLGSIKAIPLEPEQK